jgi:hypothetical protein
MGWTVRELWFDSCQLQEHFLSLTMSRQPGVHAASYVIGIYLSFPMGEVGGAAPTLSHMTLWLALGQIDLHVCFLSLLLQRSGKTLHFLVMSFFQ